MYIATIVELRWLLIDYSLLKIAELHLKRLYDRQRAMLLNIFDVNFQVLLQTFRDGRRDGT
jgi:hypothetical protein